METNDKKCTRGGARPGAGRPKVTEPRKAHSFSCTDAEAETIKKLLFFLRTYPELIDAYYKRLLAKCSAVQAEKPTLQWLESEDETEENQKTSSKKKSANFQWLESESEEIASSKEISERINRSVDTVARGIAEMLAK